MQDEDWMQEALILAEKAEALGEVPVGAVLVKDDKIIGRGWNQTITTNDPSAHAEILAMRDAGQQLNNYRLIGTTMYVTLEPCAMCAMAMVHARVERIVYATPDPRTGSVGSVYDIPNDSRFNHQINCDCGVLAEEASTMLRDFFRTKRAAAKAAKLANRASLQEIVEDEIQP